MSLLSLIFQLKLGVCEGAILCLSVVCVLCVSQQIAVKLILGIIWQTVTPARASEESR